MAHHLLSFLGWAFLPNVRCEFQKEEQNRNDYGSLLTYFLVT